MCWVIKPVTNGYEVGYFSDEIYYVEYEARNAKDWVPIYVAKNMEDAFAVCSYLNGGTRP